MSPVSMNEIKVYSLGVRFGAYEKNARNSLLGALEILKKKGVCVEVYFVNGARMRLVNWRFRGKDKSADVLSFKEPAGFPHPESKLKHLGEIYLSPRYVRKEVRLAKLSITKLLIHGLLHLLGYNHKKRNDRIRMEKKERQLLKFLMTNS